MVKKYHTEEERLEAQRQSVKKYQQSDKYKAAQKKYSSSEKRKQYIRKYQQSDKFKKYQKEYLKEYLKRPEVKERRKILNQSEVRKQYQRDYQRNISSKSEKRKEYLKHYHRENYRSKTPEQKAKFLEYQKEYIKRPDVREKINERRKLKRKLNPEKARERDKKYRERNKLNAAVSKKRRETIRLWAQKKRATDVFHRLRSSLTARISQALKKKKGNKKAPLYSLIGCSKDQLIKHLESKFYTNNETNEPMTWDNYGRGGWEVDHKMPIDSFKDQDITSLETQKKIMHYTNLQPMWGNENKAKSNKILND